MVHGEGLDKALFHFLEDGVALLHARVVPLVERRHFALVYLPFQQGQDGLDFAEVNHICDGHRMAEEVGVLLSEHLVQRLQIVEKLGLLVVQFRIHALGAHVAQPPLALRETAVVVFEACAQVERLLGQHYGESAGVGPHFQLEEVQMLVHYFRGLLW